MASIKLKGDTSGEITIQAPSVAGTQTLNLQAASGTLATTAQASVGTKNLIINGDMRIAQRGTSQAGITSNGYYTVDRWYMVNDTAGTWTQTQDTDVPTGQGFATSVKLACTTADASLSAGDGLQIHTRLEGQNLQHLKKGTANAESLTVSFWVKSNKTGTYIYELYDQDNARQVSKSYTIDTADTWEKKTITIDGDTTGSFDNDNNLSLSSTFWFAAGSNKSSGTLNTSWASTVTANRVVGQTNLADSTSNYINITGLQLEVGDTATPFEHRPYDMELARCQRYTYRHSAEGDIDNYAPLGMGRYYATNAAQLYVPFKVTMRVPPSSVTQVGNVFVNDTGFGGSAITLVLNERSSSGATLAGTATTGTTAGNATTFYANDTSSAALIFSAEL